MKYWRLLMKFANDLKEEDIMNAEEKLDKTGRNG